LLAGFSSLLLIIRSILNVFVDKYFYTKLEDLTNRLVGLVLNKHFSTPYEKRYVSSKSQFSFGVNESLSSLSIYVIGSLVIVASEIVNVIILIGFLFFWEPEITLMLTTILGLSAFSAFRYHIRKTFQLRNESADIEWSNTEELSNLEKISDELKVRDLLRSRIVEYSKIRSKLSRTIIFRQIQFGFPKLFLEISIIVGGLVAAVSVWYFLNANQALITLVTYMIVGFRIQPAAMKIQNGFQIFLQHMSFSEIGLDILRFYSKNEVLEHGKNRHFSEMGMSKILIQDLEYSFADGGRLFTNLNLEITSPGIYLIQGANGAGKSTLLEILAGLRSPSNGSIRFGEFDFSLMQRSDIKRIISYCPQKPNFVNQTLEESFLLDSLNNPDYDNQRKRLVDCLRILDFDLSKYIGVGKVDLGTLLSEGEKLKVGIARTLALGTPIILLDEPSAALDSKSTSALLDILQELSSVKLILVASHDYHFENMGNVVIRVGESK
jgi:ABC-type bacteriocin/lantibiotic exporter with double-glycine peptidase domain